MAAANKRPEIGRAFTYFNARTPSYKLTVDRDKCKKMGVSLTEVFNTIQTYLGSTYINDFTIYNREFHVIVQADTLFRNDIADMNKYYVRNYLGNMLPLSAVMSYKVEEMLQCCHILIFIVQQSLSEVQNQGLVPDRRLKHYRKLAQRYFPKVMDLNTPG